MTSRKTRNTRNVSAHSAFVSVAPKALVVALKAAPAPSDDRSALERIEPVMAEAIRRTAAGVVQCLIEDALSVATNGLQEWQGIKAVRYTVLKDKIARMYENERLGTLALRGLEKKAAKEALWEALFSNETFIVINNEHKALVERKQAAYEKRTAWAVQNQNNRKGKTFQQEDVADWKEVQAYMAAQRRLNG